MKTRFLDFLALVILTCAALAVPVALCLAVGAMFAQAI